MQNLPSSQALLSGMALVVMGVLAMGLMFKSVPENNVELVTFALGAISGALTMGSGTKSTPAAKPPTLPAATPDAPATNGNGNGSH